MPDIRREMRPTARTERTTYLLLWKNIEEQHTDFGSVIDRYEALEARGIKAEVIEVVAGRRRPLPT